MLQLVRKQSLSDAVFEQIRDRILAGSFAAGEALPAERQLCEALGVNRGAVREALKRLEQARLISIQHGGGTRVLDFRHTASLDLLVELIIHTNGQIDAKVVRSIAEMRIALAPDVARLAALRGGVELADVLDRIVEAMRNASGDVAKLQDLSDDFWDELITACDNVAYRLSYNSLLQAYAKFRDLLREVFAEEVADLPSFAAIATAVRTANAAQAESAARVLLNRGTNQIFALVETLSAMK